MSSPGKRSRVGSARRGGQADDEALQLQLKFAEEIQRDLDSAGLSVNALAAAIGIKQPTLSGYLTGRAPWPVGVIKSVAGILGRSSDADLVALGFVSSPLAHQFLRGQRRFREYRAARRVASATALVSHREPLAESPGAQLAAALLTSPDATPVAFEIGLRRLWRGKQHQHEFGELMTVDLPLATPGGIDLVLELLATCPVRSWTSRFTNSFADAMAELGATFERGPDLSVRLRRQYELSERAALIVVPKLLAVRPDDPAAANEAYSHLEGMAVTGLHFSGPQDVAALVAEDAGWGYAGVRRLVRQTFDIGRPRPHGGQEVDDDPAGNRAYHAHCRDVSALLLDPQLREPLRAVSLDEPSDALRALRAAEGAPDPRQPIAVLRISEARMRWIADRWAVTRPGGGQRGDDQADADYRRLVHLQDDLTEAAKSLTTHRPIGVFTVPEPELDYADTNTDTADEDFDAFVIASRAVAQWAKALDR